MPKAAAVEIKPAITQDAPKLLTQQELIAFCEARFDRACELHRKEDKSPEEIKELGKILALTNKDYSAENSMNTAYYIQTHKEFRQKLENFINGQALCAAMDEEIQVLREQEPQTGFVCKVKHAKTAIVNTEDFFKALADEYNKFHENKPDHKPLERPAPGDTSPTLLSLDSAKEATEFFIHMAKQGHSFEIMTNDGQVLATTRNGQLFHANNQPFKPGDEIGKFEPVAPTVQQEAKVDDTSEKPSPRIG